MKIRFPILPAVLALLFIVPAGRAAADVFIDEIMYQPAGIPEPANLEFIELRNSGAAPVNLAGWRLNKGVNFTFTTGTVISPGGFLVVASDVAAFSAAHPGVAPVTGGWTGNLSNTGEEIRLVDAAGATVDSITYADEGDWALRVRESNFNGWDWQSMADGGGRSLELRNPAVQHDHGQNWGASSPAGGTPGAVNSLDASDIAPLISKVRHSPAVPTSAEPVTISCQLRDESAPETLSASLRWRMASSVTPPAFASLAMTGDGGGSFSIDLPPMPNGTIVEFYISASDAAATRTWPAATSEGQNANCQFQVDDEAPNATDSYYRLVLTAAENAAFTAVSSGSDRQFNQTLIISRGIESTVRYRSAMRIRGNSSRGYQFKPLRISIPSDTPVDGVTSFNLNPRSSYLQYLGMRLFEAAGLRATDAIPVELRRNGVEQTTSGGGTPDFGKWVRAEDYNSEMVSRHWPEAGGGNIYKKGRPDQFWRNRGWTVPSNANGTIDGFSKQNNGAANDWSDLTGFFATFQAAAAPHFPGEDPDDVGNSGGGWDGTAFTGSEITSIETVADLDQWARWFAVMTILEDNETNISNGQDDDYAVYFIPTPQGRRRLQLLPHDLDTILGQGDAPLAPDARGLFDATANGSVFSTLLPLFGNNSTAGNAAFRAKYFQAIRELYGTVFNADPATDPNPAFYQLVDSHLQGWVPAATRTGLKDFARQRQAHLLGLIGAGAIVPPPPSSISTLASPHGDVMIHEVLANNAATLTAGGGTPDVIELRNTGATPFDLSGASITDDPAEPAKHVFPAGATIPANGYLILYGEIPNAPAQPDFLPFALNNDGEGVFLYRSPAAGGALLDSVVFGPQIADRSIGRTGANLDTWALGTPSIGAPNNAVSGFASLSGVRINEWLGNKGYMVDDDFLELYNPAALPAALGGAGITDDPINYPARHVLPALSFIAPGGFVKLAAKGGSASPLKAAELPFGIDSTFGSLAAMGANGTAIDRVDVVSQLPDVSRARVPDGGAAVASQALPSAMATPGQPNAAPAGILALMNQLRVTEILYAPNTLEFIELQNIGAAPLDLSGVRFTKGVGYEFAPGTSLAAGALVVICKDRAAFQAQYGNLSNLAPGEFTGTLDNAGEVVVLQPPAPWDVNILSFEYRPDWHPLTNANHSLTVVAPELTPPGAWDRKSTWVASGPEFGTPGTPGPPIITSPLVASGRLGEAFSYQIVAVRNPVSYQSQTLPQGLALNGSTGLISGTPSAAGLFSVVIGAANAAGSDMKTLVLTIESSGPLAGFEWNAIPSAQASDVPFAASIRAVDAQGLTVSSFNGTARLSTETSDSPIVLTELDTDTIDYFEIQNVSGAAVDATGWFVAVNATGNGNSAVSTPTGTLPPSLSAGQVLYRTDRSSDGPNYYGVNIAWPSGNNCWAMIVDNLGNIRDFVAVGYSSAEIAAMSITVNGFTLAPGAKWSGAGVTLAGNTTSTVLLRGGAADHNDASDWAWGATPPQFGTQNPGLTLPFPNSGPLPVSPAVPVQFINGVWSGNVTVSGTRTGVRLRAADTAGHAGTSNPIDLSTSPRPVIVSPLAALGVIGQPFSHQIVATNSPTGYAATGLPAGLSVDGNTGLISGIPAGAGTASVSLFAVGTGGNGTATLALEIQNDADQDGMGDAWELAHGLSPGNAGDAALDADGDGQSNRAEWLAGTAPDDTASVFRILSAGASGADFQIVWRSAPGRRYRVMTSMDLAGASGSGWTILTASPVVALDASASYTHAGGAAGPERFYRVEIIP